MSFYQLGKRMLKYMGLLTPASHIKHSWKPFWLQVRYRALLLSRSKGAYMRFFDDKYNNLLKGGLKVFDCDVDRYKSYRLMFGELLRQRQRGFTIIETGCAFGSGWCHGRSSFLFMEFLNIFGGKLISIDINQQHVDACARIIETIRPQTGRACYAPRVGDSLSILQSLPDKADLVYLDSWDLEREDPEPSMRHHLAELHAAKDIFKRSKDLIVAVDDNLKPLGIGKGKYIKEWALATHQDILMDNYQLVLRIAADKMDGI
jgi:hypothetical protein